MPKQNLCSVCKKEAGICNCAGCKAFFCTKDFMDHRQWLSGEFENVIEVRNRFQEKVSEKKQIKHLQNTLLSQVDQWQNITIEKVRYAAEKTRHEIIEMLNDKTKDIEHELDNVTGQMRALQDMKNFVEDDLAQLKDNIDKLREKFQQITEPPSVKLHKEKSEEIEWTSVIYVNEKCAHGEKVIVSCLLANANCPWTGPSDQLDNHLLACSFGSRRSKLHKYHDTNEQLKEKLKHQKIRIDVNEFEIRQLRQQLEQRENQVNANEIEIGQLKEQVNKQKYQISMHEAEFRQMKEQLKQKEIQINANETCIYRLKEEVRQKNIQLDVYDTRVRQAKEQLREREAETGLNTVTIRQLKMQLEQRDAEINSMKTELIRKEQLVQT